MSQETLKLILNKKISVCIPSGERDKQFLDGTVKLADEFGFLIEGVTSSYYIPYLSLTGGGYLVIRSESIGS